MHAAFTRFVLPAVEDSAKSILLAGITILGGGHAIA